MGLSKRRSNSRQHVHLVSEAKHSQIQTSLVSRIANVVTLLSSRRGSSLRSSATALPGLSPPAGSSGSELGPPSRSPRRVAPGRSPADKKAGRQASVRPPPGPRLRGSPLSRPLPQGGSDGDGQGRSQWARSRGEESIATAYDLQSPLPYSCPVTLLGWPDSLRRGRAEAIQLAG